MTASPVHPAAPRPAALAASRVTQGALIEALAAVSSPAASALVISPPADGPGSWAGAPCAIRAGADIWLGYRLRRPVGSGRGFVNVIARSGDGLAFETVAILTKDAFGAESLERPALVHTPDGRWRLYLSCATPGTAHWRVDLLEADTPAELPHASRRTVLTGSTDLAVKDPVVMQHGGRWHLWASVHPLGDRAATDRMWTEHATSSDGIDWTWHGTALAGRPGRWDSRGVRIAAVVPPEESTGGVPLALYDGRATAEQNWEERTGIASGSLPGSLDGSFRSVGADPEGTSPHGAGGLRYASIVGMPDGSTRLYAEVTRPDGAHELRTCLLPTSGE